VLAWLVQTDGNIVPFILRMTLAVVMFPHGAQHALGWFGGVGFKPTVAFFRKSGVPAPLAVLRGRHRRRFLVKAGREVKLQAVLRDWLSRVRVAGSARIQVDIDPYSFL